MNMTKKFTAEAIGTGVLVFLACGTAMITGANVVATALAFGLAFIAMAFVIGPISGCHINPAVSLGMLICKKMNAKEFGIYVAAQFLGAVIGTTFLYGIFKAGGLNFGGWATNSYTLGFVTDAGTVIASLVLEVILTFVFVFAVLGATSKKEYAKFAGVIVGLTLTVVYLVGINITGASVNPARSFGPALMSWIFGNGATDLGQIWLFIVAPMIGAVIAALTFSLFYEDKEEKKKD